MSQVTLTPDLPRAARRRQEFQAKMLWTAFILVFFVLQAILWTVAISAVSNDPSHAVAASYEKNTMDWTQQQVLMAESAKLGWQVDVEVLDQVDASGLRKLRLTVLDRESRPIDRAHVTLNAFHMSRAGEPQRIPMTSTAQGLYVGTIKVAHAGRWKFEGVVQLGDRVYRVDQLQQLSLRGKQAASSRMEQGR